MNQVLLNQIVPRIGKELSITESVYRALHKDLVQGRFPSGARLKTSELAQSYGVSLAAVREALTRLSSEGLVEARPQHGFRSSPLSVERLQDLTEARVVIESVCIGHSIANFDLLKDLRLEAAMNKMLEAAEFDQEAQHIITDIWSLAHFEFHEGLMCGCRNQVLLHLRRQLFDQSEPYRHVSTTFQRTKQEIKDAHYPIMEAVIARDVERAKALIADHIRGATRMLLASHLGP